MVSGMDAIRALRDGLLANREDWDAACASFAWPALDEFNWALDWFDGFARGNDGVGLLVVEADGSSRSLTFDELVTRSDQLANWLRAQGVARGDRIVLMLGNQIELWETMLAAMKLGAVVIPATTLLAESDLRDRIDRGNAKHVVVRAADAGKFDGVAGDYTRIAVGDDVPDRLARLRALGRGAERVRARRADPRVATRCSCTSPRARPRGPSSSSTPTRRIRSAI